MSDEQFVREYTLLLRGKLWPEIQLWAEQYRASPEDLVLMCWEKEPMTCHREQVYYVLQELELPCRLQLV